MFMLLPTSAAPDKRHRPSPDGKDPIVWNAPKEGTELCDAALRETRSRPGASNHGEQNSAVPRGPMLGPAFPKVSLRQRLVFLTNARLQVLG